jgi:hypothetical protein
MTKTSKKDDEDKQINDRNTTQKTKKKTNMDPTKQSGSPTLMNQWMNVITTGK